MLRLTRRGGIISSTPLVHDASLLVHGLGVDAAGAIYLLAGTDVFKLDPAASHIRYRTSIGRYVAVQSLALGPGGAVYLAGGGPPGVLRLVDPIQAAFPRRRCGYDESIDYCTDAVIASLDRHGRITFASYLGGRWDDASQAIAVDGAGTVFVLGTTDSTDFPLRRAQRCTIDGPILRSGDDGPTTQFLTALRL